MKVSQIKSKVAAKVAKGEAKVAKRCGKCSAAKTTAALFTIFSLFVNSGCQNPAQRAQTAETRIYIYGGATANFGSEFVSLAQSNETGGNDAGLTASPTTDTKPEIAVGVGGSSAGVGQGGGSTQSGKFAKIGAAADAISDLIPAKESKEDAAGEPVKADAAECAGGACGEGACEECNFKE